MILKRVCIIGWGNISKYVKKAIENSNEFELAGIVRRKKSITDNIVIPELYNIDIVDDISKLKNIDIAILCVPSKNIEILTEELILKGISSVNCYDDEENINYFKDRFDNLCKEHNVTVLHGIGFNPGIKTVIDVLFNIMCSHKIKYEQIGPCISLGLSSKVRTIEGVKDAITFIEPLSISKHAIKIYLEINQGFDFIDIRKEILKKIEFKYQDIDIELVDNVNEYKSMGMKYKYLNIGTSSDSYNQNIEYNMNVNLPALIGQILVNGASACMKQESGIYDILDIPLKNFLK